MSCFILCQDCGAIWDVSCGATHSCGGDYGTAGTCEICDQYSTDAFYDGSKGTTQHRDPFECIHFLRQQIRYLEQSALEHDSRYTDLEIRCTELGKSVAALTEGRRAAVEATKEMSHLTISKDNSVVDE